MAKIYNVKIVDTEGNDLDAWFGREFLVTQMRLKVASRNGLKEACDLVLECTVVQEESATKLSSSPIGGS